ncbi:MAG: triple tyrosine motif-containing protein [Paludibacter sp.]|nr:triple tyrosine motif-containing protein [Paludibacter sp.]
MRSVRNILILFCLSLVVVAQDFTPIVKQFGKQDYGASNQNWSVAQDSRGLMYFANNQGLLQFDGNLWELFRMPQNKLVRSVYIDKQDRIYVGSFEEFGYFEKLQNGKLIYKSLSDSLKGYSMMNDEIWTIFEINNTIIFQSFTSYFTFKKGIVEGHRQPVTFLFFSPFGNDVLVNTKQHALCRLDLEQHRLIPFPQKPVKGEILTILPLDSKRYIAATVNDGLYLFDGRTFSRFTTDADDFLKQVVVNRAVITPDKIILLGTIQHGVIAFNKEGKRLWMLNQSNVLQNNTVLGMLIDKGGNAWLALDKGIAYLQLNSDIRFINSFDPPIGAVYDVKINGAGIFLGTNQGLFKGDFQKNSVRKVSPVYPVKGQVWNISAYDNQYFIGNNDVGYQLGNGVPKLSSPVQGGFCIKKGIIHGNEVLVEGTYTQLCIYLKKNGVWQFSHTVDGFVNPVRYLEIDYTGRIWASHLHQGLFSIELSQDLKKIDRMKTYNSLDGVNKYNINVFSVNNRVVFTDHHAFYTYDDIEKQIIPYKELNESLGHAVSAFRVAHFKSNYYWFIKDSEASLFRIKEGKAELMDIVQYSLFKNQTVDNYQQIVPVNDDQCLFTLENGLALYQYNPEKKAVKNVELQLKTIAVTDVDLSEVQYLPLYNYQKKLQIPFRKNNVTFTVYYPDYTQMNNVMYRFRLEGLDKLWGAAGQTNRKVYDYLPHGSYVLHVEALDNSGLKLSELSYAFEVKPPFYWSIAARLFYLLLIILFIYGTMRFFRNRYLRRHLLLQKEQEDRQRYEIEKKEQEIIALKNEKLEADLTLKSKELAESTMSLINKNEMLVSLKEEVIRQKAALGTQYPNKYADKLIRMIDENISSEDDWIKFQANFDRIHENFFRHLHRDYPDLTSNDLRFCAYLRLNLSSKDIAHLMNITLKGVEVARYRIRKKINLPSHKSLTEFMIEFK